MRGIRPRGRCQGESELDALACPLPQVGRGFPVIAVEAQVVGADGVPDDEDDVSSVRLWCRELARVR